MKIVVKGKVLKHVTIVAGNGKTRLTSETFYSKSNAVRAAKTLAEDTGWKVVVE